METLNIYGELFVLKSNIFDLKSDSESETIVQLLNDNLGFYFYCEQKKVKIYTTQNNIKDLADSLFDILSSSKYVGEYAINSKGTSNDFLDNKYLVLYTNNEYVIVYNEDYENNDTIIPIKIFKSNFKNWISLHDKKEIFKNKQNLYQTIYKNGITKLFQPPFGKIK